MWLSKVEYRRWLMERMVMEQGHRCYWCSRRFAPRDGGNPMLLPTFDHVVPKSQGGAHTYANGVAACCRCNNEKADLMPDVFLRWRYGIDRAKAA